jgi:hypothetical protein
MLFTLPGIPAPLKVFTQYLLAWTDCKLKLKLNVTRATHVDSAC